MKKIIYLSLCLCLALTQGYSQRQMENLGRGLIAIHQGEGKVFVSWRMLGNDDKALRFNVYRSSNGEKAIRLNQEAIIESTCYLDENADLTKSNSYFVKPVLNSIEQEQSASFTLKANAPVRQYLSIPVKEIPNDSDFKYVPADASVGDLDGDGEYEIVVKRELKPRDNSHKGITGQTKLEAYKLDGTFLWRVDLGANIREGSHYTQFIVYDFDGDGKAEISVKTAEGTTFGDGTQIGDVNKDGITNYVNADGFILDGPEFLSIIEGATGKELARTDYIPRGDKSQWNETWGDDHGNRIDRYLAGVGYFDGKNPSVLICRGYYGRAVIEALNYKNGKLKSLWTFDSDANKKNRAYRGQGNHSLRIGDVDGDGKDEVIYGACAIDHNGKGLYSTGLGHGDAMQLSDIDPDREGLEVFDVHEHPTQIADVEFRDAKTGKLIWGMASTSGDVGRGLSTDIDPRYRGYECWSANDNFLYNCKGEKIADSKPNSCNMAVWWDGDLIRELLDKNTISKWDYKKSESVPLFQAEGTVSNNGTKATPCLSADIFGDWREEVILRTPDNKELRIYTTTIPTSYRFYTFMHDPIYRMSVAVENVAYNQPPATGFYMGEGMKPPPTPFLKIVKRQK